MSKFPLSLRLGRAVATTLLLATLTLSGCQEQGKTADEPVSNTSSPTSSVASAPTAELTPGKVKAGQGVESISLGLSKAQVTKILGAPEEVDANEFSPGQTYACYYAKGIELSFANDKLSVITLQSPSSDPKYQTYAGATEQGLGIGSTADQIIESLGEPAPDTPRALRYPQLGLWFRLDNDRGAPGKTARAQSVQVMKPET